MTYDDLLTYASIDIDNVSHHKKIGYFSFDSSKGAASSPAMAIDELQTGDILLLADLSERTHKEISIAQAVFNQERLAQSKLTHAGIFDANGKVILEASGEAGLRRYPLASKKKGYKYQIWRLDCPSALTRQLEIIAVDIANSLIEAKEMKQTDFFQRGAGKTFGCYSIINSFMGFSKKGQSASRELKTIKENIFAERLFFCSNFVLECFELSRLKCGYSSQLFDVDYRYASPKNIQASLMRHGHQWKYSGYYVSEGIETHFKLPTYEAFLRDRPLYSAASSSSEIVQNIRQFHYIPISSATVKVLMKNIPLKQHCLNEIIKAADLIIKAAPKNNLALARLRQQAIHDWELLISYM
ncbi:MAG: hypothetical protein GY750_11410 [Lentisphaerae bacterium]|nr:hypothetical protein [Lentisphaerota bacterium]